MSNDTNRPDKHDLLAAFDQVVEREKTRAATTASPSQQHRGPGIFVVLLCVLSWGALAYTWLARPAWLFPPDPATLLTPAQKEASLRFGMYLQMERVRDFRRTNGRLPAQLEETGQVEDSVTYRVTGDTTFVIAGTTNGLTLELANTDSPAEFLKSTGIKPPPGQ